MRGRKPRPLTLDADDVPILEAISRSRSLPWSQVQHTRILLGIAAGQRVGVVAFQMQCDAATVWRVCRGYERRGLTLIRLIRSMMRMGSAEVIRCWQYPMV